MTGVAQVQYYTGLYVRVLECASIIQLMIFLQFFCFFAISVVGVAPFGRVGSRLGSRYGGAVERNELAAALDEAELSGKGSSH